jgi:N utilization substance protein B
MSGNRRKSRELALQVLFQKEFVEGSSLVERLGYFRESFAISDEVLEYARHLLQFIEENSDKIDAKIREKSLNWSLERISKVDLCILRLGTTELMMPKEIPPKVAINEAIELAKKYGNTDSAGFINGILNEQLKDQ